jgi:hypothetical protein
MVSADTGGGFGFYQADGSPTGQAGIAIANDSGKLCTFFIGGSNNPIVFYRDNAVFNSNTSFSIFSTSYTSFYTNSLERMRITVDGRIGIGTTSPQQMLSVNGSIVVDQAGANNGSGASLIFGPGSGEGIGSNRNPGPNQYGLDFYAGGSKRMFISNTGGVFIGAGAYAQQPGDLGVSRGDNTGAIYFGGSQQYIYYNGAAWQFTPPLTGVGGSVTVVDGYNNAVGTRPHLMFQTGIGLVLNLSDNATLNCVQIYYNTTSDIRLKQNIRELTGGISIINQLRPVEAEWNGLAQTKAGQRVVSVIAQDLQTVLPGAIDPYRNKLHPEDDEAVELWGYNPNEILFQCVLAIQQLAARLEKLEKQLEVK